MGFVALANAIGVLADFLVLLIVLSAVLSFFMSPYHPLRVAIDRVVDPMLNPIRQVVPPAGMFDFSPLILILLIEFLARFITSILLSL